MTPTPVTPVNEYPVQKTVFDLDSCDKVTLVKTYTFEPVADFQSALARLNNDNAKLLEVVNDGLRAEQQRAARKSTDGWYIEPEDEDDEKTAFTGTVADVKKVNGLVLTLAKLRGFAKGISRDKKKAIKADVLKTIKETPALREMLAGATEDTTATE